jgi:hypothetical protein
MTGYRYQIDPRPAELGGGWNLKLFQDDLEVGGSVFPVNADADPQAGMDWFNGLQEHQRAHWLQTASSARPVDAWGAYLSAEAYRDALENAESWLVCHDQ